ncbi:MFS transporter [Rhodococcus sp. BP-252]|uniref:MDR family MFS transporter n=1 Tax=unclassified Rhodococcus (in: high G+C Gram-positive bacteria) TaxID=192944 RepID=UPI001C9A5A40|nr:MULTISPECIES: MDR family MFS transporter [unclassified Rhodococcus (in: high G+C Gram-positive bacteria)]MBY6412769.1 MFS transporter [Rhodococcus sp. BP-320]MBY6417433.1 MFS transporter [Rhodococcus sp. BP-321]MBY6421789.1 MFS transporter [Rhodococcus sp. BP-324]MBY6427528.1 MFS transporter [Rhodococcus sp. BP-323]MBY6432621.1 MFS transporter [Rhodococcus sp. BP-322]
MATNQEVPDVGFRSERGPILIALMLSTSLVALDSTIIATAVLTIVGDLGGFGQFPWLFSIYLLAQAVSVPIYGKLADLFGRKKVMLWGIGVFLLGSILCGLAWSMPALIAFRAVQGLGAGAVQPMSVTIAGDIYTLQERAKAQGYLASVWAMSAVLGPALGGIFSEFLSWRWIFFVNIPLCLLAGWVLIRRFHEGALDRTKPKIDYAGAALLTIGAAAVLLGLLEGGQSWAWASPISISIFVGGVVALALFTWQQTRAAEPILPLWVFTRRVLVVSSLISLLVGAIVLGLTSYVPTFVQGVLGTGAIVAGFAVATLTLGWPIAASLSGRFYLRFGFRATAMTGGTIAVVGAGATTLVGSDSPIWMIAAVCFVVGLGMGLIASPTLIAAQTSVEWEERGVATSTNMFARSIGSAVGVAIFGAVVNSRVSGDPDPAQLSDAVHLVFVGVFVTAVVMLAAAALMPKAASPHVRANV